MHVSHCYSDLNLVHYSHLANTGFNKYFFFLLLHTIFQTIKLWIRKSQKQKTKKDLHFPLKKDRAVHEWRSYEQSNSQILPVKVLKLYSEENFQSFVTRYFHYILASRRLKNFNSFYCSLEYEVLSAGRSRWKPELSAW